MKLAIINGPNLNLLGKREPEVYGSTSFDSYLNDLRQEYPEIEISYFQSNVEGEIVNYIQEVGFSFEGIILNAGAYTHTSIAIRDAISSVTSPTIEVHISNIDAREDFRRKSYLTEVCKGLISGLGLKGYRLAIQYFKK